MAQAPALAARVAIVALRYPPEGAFDFALKPLLRRNLDLVSSVVVIPSSVTPDEGLDQGQPQQWLFRSAGCSHVIALSGWTTTGSDLVMRADVHAATGLVGTASGQATMDDVSQAAASLALEVVRLAGARPTPDEAGWVGRPSLSPGPAFSAFTRYWHGVYGGTDVDWQAELHQAAAGYPEALRYVSGWDANASDLEGFSPDVAEHLGLIQRAVESDPLLISAVADLANLLVASGRAAEALPVLDQALSWAASSPSLWLARLSAADGLMQRDEVHAAAQRAWDLAPWDPATVRGLAYSMHLQGRAQDRIDLLRSAVDGRPSGLFLRYLLGVSLNDARQWSEALAVLSETAGLVDQLPWHAMPFKVPHLDYHDSTRWALSYPLALASAGAGQDARPWAAAHIDLSPAPDAYGASLGGVDGLLASLKTRAMLEDPTMAAAAGTGPDGGVTDLESYVHIAFEAERAQATGADMAAVLTHLGTDTGNWLKAQSFWADKMSADQNIAMRFAELRSRYEAAPPPMPDYPAAQAPVAAMPTSAEATDSGGVPTLEDWARVSGGIQRAMAQGLDMTAALAAVGLDMTAYQNAAAYWSARITEDPDLGMALAQAMAKYM